MAAGLSRSFGRFSSARPAFPPGLTSTPRERAPGALPGSPRLAGKPQRCQCAGVADLRGQVDLACDAAGLVDGRLGASRVADRPEDLGARDERADEVEPQ